MKVRIEIDTKTFVRFWLVVIGFGLAGLMIYASREALMIIGTALPGGEQGFNIAWVEEPIWPPEDIPAIARIRAAAVGGEHPLVKAAVAA